MPEQFILALVGPSGVGKTTICRYLAHKFENLQEVISTTTRDPRPKEEDGIDYHFLTSEESNRRLNNGEFLEHVEYDGNTYGFLRSSFLDPLNEGKNLIAVVERHGLKQLRSAFPNLVVGVLILPPDLNTLKERLRADGRDDKTIERRLKTAEEEMTGSKALFDHQLINDDLDDCLMEARALYRGLVQKRKEQ